MKKKSKKILVTGGAGFIGAHLTQSLIRSGHKVLVVDLLRLQGGIPFVNKKCKFIKGDITDKKILKKIKNWKPEIIYHLAAQSAVEPAYDDPKFDLISNSYGTYVICNLAKELNVKTLIYTSSVAVYGNNPTNEITEHSEIKPDSLYGVTKYSGEMFVKQILKNTKVRTIILRVFNTYGPGENLNNLKKGMVSIYSSYVWKNKKIIVKGSLKRFRDLIYIKDCVDILKKSMFIKFKKKDEIFYLSSGIKYNVRTILKKIIKASNKKKNYPIKISKGTPGDSFGFHTKSKKLKKLFKFKPNYNLDKGLKFYFQWIKKVPNVKNLKKYHPFEIGKF